MDEEEEEEEENHTYNCCPNFYPYVPGKSNSTLSNRKFNSPAFSEKDTSDSTSVNNNERLFTPINRFSSEFRKIDADLKKMHKLWSNID